MGAAVKITRGEHTASDLRQMSRSANDSRATQRLLALALIIEGKDRKSAAQMCGMDRQTLRDWVHRYNEHGVAGLYDRKSTGAPRRLTTEQHEIIRTWVENGPDADTEGIVRWRRVDLKKKIETEFGVTYDERTVGTLLRKLGFARLSVRPQHPKANQADQDAFKKTLPIL